MGRAIVEAFVAEGIRVAAVDINEAGLEPIVAASEGLVTAFVFDISDPDAVHDGFRAIESEVGSIDILVNNAGILSNNKALDTTPEEWNRVMAINLNGAFYLTREALPAMRQAKWGRIINTSSYAAKSGGLTAEQRAEVEAKIPVGRFCEPEEFAHGVLFLASEKSGFITGEIVDMNGGFHFD